MSHSFVHQPDKSGTNLRQVFSEFAKLDNLKRVDMVVAWAKRTGIRAIRQAVASFREDGVYVRAIIGISQAGTSRQALQQALSTFDETCVYHVPGRTFHPKIYLATATDHAIALVGSHNLTAGGATNNFEAGVLSRLDLSMKDDEVFHAEIMSYIQRLRNDTHVCLRLDDALLAYLSGSTRYPLDDEDQRRQRQASDPVDEDQSTDEEGLRNDLFAKSSTPLTRVYFDSGALASAVDSKTPPAEAKPPVSSFRDPIRPDDIVCRWFKVLGAIDAQQPISGNPSNTMTLVQGGHGIDHATYFRERFFAGAAWNNDSTRSGKPREVAEVEFTVIVDSVTLGQLHFDIRHTPDYGSGQGNRTTELRWNSTMASYLKKHSLVGRVVSLEKYTAERYRLIIGKNESGVFVK